MKQGEQLGPEVVQRIVEMRRDYPAWSQRRIAGEIFKELHLRVHRSTVGRCLQRAGIRRQVPRQVEGKDSQDATRDKQASKEHTEPLRSLVRMWQEQCRVDPPSALIYQWAKQNLSSDFIVRMAEDKVTAELYEPIIVRSLEDVLVRLPIEQDPLFPFLSQHLEVTSVVKEYEHWRSAVARSALRLGMLCGTVNEACNQLMTGITGSAGEGGANQAMTEALVRLWLTYDVLAIALRELSPQWWVRDELTELRKLRAFFVLFAGGDEAIALSAKIGAQAKGLWDDPNDSIGIVRAARRVFGDMAKLHEMTQDLKRQLGEVESRHPFPGRCSRCP